MNPPDPSQQNLDPYAKTLIHFETPLPLLRHPIPALPEDTPPTKGPYTLAFKDPKSYLTAYKTTIHKLTHQCESEARVACSVAASNNCAPPWWHTLIGRKPQSLRDRQLCEEREMGECIDAARRKCAEFAKEKCAASFGDAWVVGLKREEAWRLVWLGSVEVERSRWVGLVGFGELGRRVLGGGEFGVGSCRGRDIFGVVDNVDRILSACGLED